ncbi:MAG: amidohydrolase family protein [Actinomycetota bacterium]
MAERANLDRFDWLAQTVEPAIDPHRPIVDAHHHLWDRNGSVYLAAELLADVAGSHNVVRTVFVECGSDYDQGRAEQLRPVGETDFVRRQATDAERTGDGPVIGAIVGHADMMLGDAVEEVLAAHVEAGGGLFRGIRHATSWDASDEIRPGHSRPFGQMMRTPEFQAGVRTLAGMGLSFDAWLFHTQLDDLGALADAVPEATIVLDHLGGPLGVGPYAGGREAVRADWRAAIARVARRENVVVKIGGIGMEWYFGMGWAARPAPPGSEEVAAYWSDDVRYCIDTFGPARSLAESNFPVDRASLPYPVLWNALQIMCSGYDDAEQDRIFSGTAADVYALGDVTGDPAG